jgi:hypothetical protein
LNRGLPHRTQEIQPFNHPRREDTPTSATLRKRISKFFATRDELINESLCEKSSSLLFPYIAREKTQGAIWQMFQVSVAWKRTGAAFENRLPSTSRPAALRLTIRRQGFASDHHFRRLDDC